MNSKLFTALGLVAFGVLSAHAADSTATATNPVKEDRQALQGDVKELRQDREQRHDSVKAYNAQIKTDREKFKAAKAAHDTAGMKAAREQLKKDHQLRHAAVKGSNAEIATDKQKAKADREQLRKDRKARHDAKKAAKAAAK